MTIENSKNTNIKKDDDNGTENLRAKIVSDKELQVAAIFPSKEKAREAIDVVKGQTSIESAQIEIVEAKDPRMSEKLERNSESIGKRMWSSHLLLGCVG